MNRVSRIAVAATLGLGVAGGWMASMPGIGWAQQPPAGGPPPAQHEHRMPGRHIEGRIAFLKAELKITPAQEAMWQQVAAAMRSSAGQIGQFMQGQQPDQPPANAAERLERQAQLASLNATAAQSVATAFKPLYAAMTDEQKQVADQLIGRPMHGGKHRHHEHHMPR